MLNLDRVENMMVTGSWPEKDAYEAYFDTIRPVEPRDWFRRGLFALASVHTTWQLNVALYSALWDMQWIGDEAELKRRLKEAAAGLDNGRRKQFMHYAGLLKAFPKCIEIDHGEAWYDYRDRISDNFPGLGPAKAAFLSELLYFHDSRAVCFDTHLLQCYGYTPAEVGKVKATERARMEVHWDMVCRARGINPVTARWIMWDRKQGRPDSRYWSYVLETSFKPELGRPEQLEMFG